MRSTCPASSPAAGRSSAESPPDPALCDRLQDWAAGKIRLLTLAAELEGAERLAAHAAARGVVVSIGHTLASAQDLERLHACGAAALTHLGNGLPHLLPKFANPLWAGLADERYTAMFIADGHHIPGGVLKAMLRAKGLEHSAIGSDASPLAGMPPGRGERKVKRTRTPPPTAGGAETTPPRAFSSLRMWITGWPATNRLLIILPLAA